MEPPCREPDWRNVPLFSDIEKCHRETGQRRHASQTLVGTTEKSMIGATAYGGRCGTRPAPGGTLSYTGLFVKTMPIEERLGFSTPAVS
jgi:hypothetical protein